MLTIDKSKMQQVIKLVQRRVKMSAQQIEANVLGDWLEGPKHQKYLNESDAEVIASWIIDCNLGLAEIHRKWPHTSHR